MTAAVLRPPSPAAANWPPMQTPVGVDTSQAWLQPCDLDTQTTSKYLLRAVSSFASFLSRSVETFDSSQSAPVNTVRTQPLRYIADMLIVRTLTTAPAPTTKQTCPHPHNRVHGSVQASCSCRMQVGKRPAALVRS